MSRTPTASGRGLLIDGAVSLSGSVGERIVVRGVGERIEVDVDRSLFDLNLISRLPPRARRRRWLFGGQPALAAANVQIDLLVGGFPVGRYDGTTKGTWLARLMGFGPIGLSLGSLLIALARRPPKPADV